MSYGDLSWAAAPTMSLVQHLVLTDPSASLRTGIDDGVQWSWPRRSIVESQRAVSGLPRDVTDVEDRLRQALASFGG